MLNIPSSEKIYIFKTATDMRISFDRLAALVSESISINATSGGIYVFFNKSRDKVKILYWDKDGYALWYKRLEVGKFKIPIDESYEILLSKEMELILNGMELTRVKFRNK